MKSKPRDKSSSDSGHLVPARSTMILPTPDSSPAPSSGTRIFTPAVLLAAVKRRWYFAFPLAAVLAAVAAVATWILRPEKSTSYTLLQIAQNEKSVLRDNVQLDSSNTFTRTQLTLIRSRPVLREALKNERVAQLPVLTKQADPIEWLEKELKTELIDGTEIVRLSLTSRGDGAGLATILNSITEAYLNFSVKADQAGRLAHLDNLQKICFKAEEKVRQCQQAIQNLTRTLSAGDAQVLSLKQRTKIDEYAGLKRELVAINGKRRNLEVLISSYQSRLDPATPMVDNDQLSQIVELELNADPKVMAYEAEVARCKERLERLDDIIAPSAQTSSFRQEYQKQLSQATAALEAARKERRNTLLSRQQLSEKAALKGMLAGTKVELLMLEEQAKGLQKEVDILQQEIDKLGLNTVDLEVKRSELERSEAFFKSVWDQKERLEVELNAVKRKRVTVEAPAEEAVVLNPNARIQETAMAGVGGMLVGIFAVALFDLRRGLIHSPSDVVNGLRMTILGSLPELTNGLKGIDFLLTVPREEEGVALAEAADGMRTLLLQSIDRGDGTRGRSLMICSPSPNEGKSTLSASLAASLARSGYRTLLVDGDFRRPTLHTLFSVPVAPGLSEALKDGENAKPYIVPTAVKNLFLLPAGEFDPAAIAALPRSRTRMLFDNFRKDFNFIVLDSSPLLAVADAFMLGRFTDGLLLSVRPGVSKSKEVQDGVVRIMEHKLPFIGVVVNGVAQVRNYYRRYALSENRDKLTNATTKE